MAKRINLELSDEMYNQIKDISNKEMKPVVSIVRDAIKLYLLALDPNNELTIRYGNGREENILIL